GCHQDVAGKQFMDVLEKRFALQAKLEGQVVVQAGQIRLDVIEEWQEGLDFRGKIEGVSHAGVVKGFDAEPITRAKELLVGIIPQGESKHAPEVVDTGLVPLAIAEQDRFGVGIRAKR